MRLLSSPVALLGREWWLAGGSARLRRPKPARKTRRLAGLLGRAACWPLALGLLGWLAGVGLAPDKAAPPPLKPAGSPRPKPLGPAADNSRCFVCHLNFDEEKLAVAHAKGGVACVKCHGQSEAHAADENNGTAPDIMYPRKKIAAACAACHELEAVAKVEKHKPEDLDALVVGEKVCTDCHNEHRLSRRTRLWDRETGKPLPKAR
jgi:hypothetical protein